MIVENDRTLLCSSILTAIDNTAAPGNLTHPDRRDASPVILTTKPANCQEVTLNFSLPCGGGVRPSGLPCRPGKLTGRSRQPERPRQNGEIKTSSRSSPLLRAASGPCFGLRLKAPLGSRSNPIHFSKSSNPNESQIPSGSRAAGRAADRNFEFFDFEGLL
jgi:hypothetical protein